MISGLQAVLAELSGIPAIWAHQDAPRPPRPYLAISIINVAAHGADESTHIDGDGRQHTLGQREASVTVSCFERENAPDPRQAVTRLADLRNLLRTPSALDALYTAGLSVAGDPTVIAVPTVQGTAWQPQATLDMSLAFESRVSLEVPWIETVTGEAGIDAHGREYTETYRAEIT